MDYKKIYNGIYENNKWYNNHYLKSGSRCLGAKLLEDYKNWLYGSVIDLGCGRGHTVNEIVKLGFKVNGIDIIDLKYIESKYCQSGNVAEPLDIYSYDTSLCIDVLEHITQDKMFEVLDNMNKTFRQVILVSNMSSCINGIDIHINKKEYDKWHIIISSYFDIKDVINYHGRWMFLCERIEEDRPKQIGDYDLYPIIRLIRRKHSALFKKFNNIVINNIDKICDLYNIRWLISICDTYADCSTIAESNAAMLISSFGNYEKFWLSIISNYDLTRKDYSKLTIDGMIPLSKYDDENCHINTFNRISRITKEYPHLHKIFKAIIYKMFNSKRSIFSILDENFCEFPLRDEIKKCL